MSSSEDVEVGVEADEEHDVLYGLTPGQRQVYLKAILNTNQRQREGSLRTSMAARQDLPRC